MLLDGLRDSVWQEGCAPSSLHHVAQGSAYDCDSIACNQCGLWLSFDLRMLATKVWACLISRSTDQCEQVPALRDFELESSGLLELEVDFGVGSSGLTFPNFCTLMTFEELPTEPSSQASSMASQASDASIFSAALAILQEPDPQAKAAETHRIARLWQQQRLSTAVKAASHIDRPGRDDVKVRH